MRLRFKHFINHYFALLWILFNPHIIKNKRNLINKIRSISDKDLMNRKTIFTKSIVMRYFLFRNKKYKNLNF